MANRPNSHKSQRSTLDAFRSLRDARVAIFHPQDSNRDTLVQQLQRIGCQTACQWPPPVELPENTDMVLFLLNAEASAKRKLSWLHPSSAIPMIGMVEYENPTILDTALELGCHGVLVSPVQAKGILATLIVTIQHFRKVQQLNKRNQRLEEKLQSVNEVSAAQVAIARARGINPAEAYKVMREQAMLKRVTIEEIARAILHADGLLNH